MIFRSRAPIDPALRTGFQQVSDAEMARDPGATPPPIDFQPLVVAAHQVLDWLLDVARTQTCDPTDLEAIDRVRGAAHGAGGAGPSEEDLLVVAGILLPAFETHLGLAGLAPLFGAAYDLAEPILEKVTQATQVARTTARRTAIRIPVVVQRRRPRLAHGGDELGREPLGTVLIIG